MYMSTGSALCAEREVSWLAPNFQNLEMDPGCRAHWYCQNLNACQADWFLLVSKKKIFKLFIEGNLLL
jgi:hypothetical protein